MTWLVFNDVGPGVGRLYWNAERRLWVKVYDAPTIYKTEDEAQDVAATFLSNNPDLAAWANAGIGVTCEVGKL